MRNCHVLWVLCILNIPSLAKIASSVNNICLKFIFLLYFLRISEQNNNVRILTFAISDDNKDINHFLSIFVISRYD